MPDNPEVLQKKGPERVEDGREEREGQQVESPTNAVEGLRTAVGAQEGTFQGEAQEFGSRAEAGLTADEKGEITAIQGQEHAISMDAQAVADAIARGGTTMNPHLAEYMQTDPERLEVMKKLAGEGSAADISRIFKRPAGDAREALDKGNRLTLQDDFPSDMDPTERIPSGLKSFDTPADSTIEEDAEQDVGSDDDEGNLIDGEVPGSEPEHDNPEHPAVKKETRRRNEAEKTAERIIAQLIKMPQREGFRDVLIAAQARGQKIELRKDMFTQNLLVYCGRPTDASPTITIGYAVLVENGLLEDLNKLPKGIERRRAE